MAGADEYLLKVLVIGVIRGYPGAERTYYQEYHEDYRSEEHHRATEESLAKTPEFINARWVFGYFRIL
jgi:hypothetical protein